MRISEVNSDNYKAYLQLLGTKNVKSLDNMWGKDGNTSYEKSFEETERELAAMGYVMESRARLEEGSRIIKYIKSQVPGWQCGQPFDTKILTETNFGLGDNHLNVRV